MCQETVEKWHLVNTLPFLVKSIKVKKTASIHTHVYSQVVLELPLKDVPKYSWTILIQTHMKVIMMMYVASYIHWI